LYRNISSIIFVINNKNLISNVTNNPDGKLKGKYNKSIICILRGISWGNKIKRYKYGFNT